jgi:hypothetical protein
LVLLLPSILSAQRGIITIITGRMPMIVTQDAALPAGSHSLTIRTTEVPSGLYLLVVEDREGGRTENVVIRH